MPSFQTATDPVLTVDLSQAGNLWRLTITGEVTKVLLETEDRQDAQDEYDYVKAHYDARKAARDAGGMDEEKAERERAVDFQTRRTRGKSEWRRP